MNNEGRAFTCGKCRCIDVGVRYNCAFDRLECHCRRCRYEWSEKPSDNGESLRPHRSDGGGAS